MAATVAEPLDRRCSSAVDIDPGWYEGQPETADAADTSALTTSEPAQPAQAPTAAGEASSPGSNVPTVLSKLQKWGDYASFGQPVWPTRFIPMKTPLSHEILDNWQLPEAPKHRLTVSTLLEAQQAAGRRVGLLLDLSNHDCLYDIDIPADVQYLHVQLVAKELPPLEFVREVAAAANSFWARHPDQHIAIHCAYGFNRTGFVVCSYLIEHCGLSVDQALASFAASRPPGVKHEKFRQELWARYGSGSGGSGSSLASALPVPVPARHGVAGSSAASSATNAQLLAAAAGSAAASPGLGRSSRGALSCRSCSSSSSYTAAGWVLGGSPEVASAAAAAGAALAASPAGGAAAEAAAAAAVVCGGSPPAAGTPRCCCCDAELTAEDLSVAEALACSAGGSAAATAAAAAAAAAAPPASQRSLPVLHSDGAEDAGCHSASSSHVARSSSTGAMCQTPPQAAPMPPLPPLLLTPGRVVLGSSPGGLLRLSGRCWSSNSVGDNSSIGCSPSSSTADLVTLRTSGLNSSDAPSSSGLDSSTGGGCGGGDRDRGSPCAAAAAGGGSSGCGAGRAASLSLSQQWLGISSRDLAVGGGDRSCSGGLEVRCSSSGADGAADGSGYDVAEGSGGEDDCFQMDPYTDSSAAQEQQQQQQGFSSIQGSAGGQPNKPPRYQAVGVVCCEQAAPGCSTVQQLRPVDLDSLLSRVSITQQTAQTAQHGQPQQRDPQQLALKQVQQPLSPLQQQQQQPDCSCDCHSTLQQPVDASGGGQQAVAGYDRTRRRGGVLEGSSSSVSPGRVPAVVDAPGGAESAAARGFFSSDDGAPDPLENESFGKLTSADLLRNLRALQQTYEAN